MAWSIVLCDMKCAAGQILWKNAQSRLTFQKAGTVWWPQKFSSPGLGSDRIYNLHLRGNWLPTLCFSGCPLALPAGEKAPAHEAAIGGPGLEGPRRPQGAGRQPGSGPMPLSGAAQRLQVQQVEAPPLWICRPALPRNLFSNPIALLQTITTLPRTLSEK